MGKEDLVRIYNGILPSHKKVEILPRATTWMLSEIGQLEKGKNNMISLKWGI